MGKTWKAGYLRRPQNTKGASMNKFILVSLLSLLPNLSHAEKLPLNRTVRADGCSRILFGSDDQHRVSAYSAFAASLSDRCMEKGYSDYDVKSFNWSAGGINVSAYCVEGIAVCK